MSLFSETFKERSKLRLNKMIAIAHKDAPFPRGERTIIRALLFLLIVGLVPVRFLAAAERIRVGSASPELTARLPYLVGVEERFFAREGFEVENVITRNDPISIAAMVAGELNYSGVGAPAVVTAIHRGLPIVIVAGFRSKLFYGLVGRKGLSSLEDLKNAKIGTAGAGGLTESVIVVGLKKHGLQRSRDYNLLPVGGSRVRMQALEQGAIDASIFTPHQISALVQKGLKPLADLGSLIPDVPSHVLAMNRERARKNPDAVVRFLRAMGLANDFIKRDPDRAIEDARKQGFRGNFQVEREGLAIYGSAFTIAFGPTNLSALLEFAELKDETKHKAVNDFFDGRFIEKATEGLKTAQW
jgi:ABC-type nitrate/sulfonate/bicarbonate transport system substrate-binding protein